MKFRVLRKYRGSDGQELSGGVIIASVNAPTLEHLELAKQFTRRVSYATFSKEFRATDDPFIFETTMTPAEEELAVRQSHQLDWLMQRPSHIAVILRSVRMKETGEVPTIVEVLMLGNVSMEFCNHFKCSQIEFTTICQLLRPYLQIELGGKPI